MLGAIGIFFTIPNVKEPDDKDSQQDKGKTLTLLDLAKVSKFGYKIGTFHSKLTQPLITASHHFYAFH